MAERDVVWTHTAFKQRRNILKYWVKKNNSTLYAEKLIKLIARRTKIIASQPTAFKLSDYGTMRVSAMGHFSIYYKIATNQIIITAFWDNRQDAKKLLELLQDKNAP